ncbi:DNA polymerase III subunit delta' [Proteiniborus sp. MB09-C3]|uniref:DNA polymerase III subunit delta' n=1 Tax=Proteiniborus sp. MB09-C3 TaxID=3050072 RepID=UPI0025524586|nr:DNA polymerase III subunit delta' [Proteiniborus sp. MB09-C3]WIV12316.1 DNA polymerase III subunit delta' [Proteiniborus sp. MB09-C3]
MDFNDIIGHEKIIENLKNAIKNNTVSHSYLFEGPKSIGKEKLAKVFAKTLLCQRGGDSPCNTCPSCMKIESGNHPDFHMEYPDKDSFKKEQIEELQRTIRKIPLESNRKIYILDDVDKMTQQAQNSFLKTLEEPPGYAIIMLLATNGYSLLPTIVSRCQIVKFTPIERHKIEKALVNNFGRSEEQARFIASFSNGIIGKAIELSKSDDFKLLRDEIIEKLNTVINGDKLKIFSISEFFEQNKELIDEVMDIILLWYRDLLIYKETKNVGFLINKDKADSISYQCQKLSKQKIMDILDVVRRTKEDIHSNVNFQLAIEVMLLNIQEV